MSRETIDILIGVGRCVWLLLATAIIFALPFLGASPTWLGIPAWMLYLAQVVEVPRRDDDED